ncbi:MAG: NAD(P)-binding domain-containing protein [Actinomycetota bacterium]|nr:NAD(P)-binding domain-containing protein [Actinomycetota bacterium]
MAVIGLGRIGLPVAATLVRAGYRVAGHDVRDEASAAAEQVGVACHRDVEGLLGADVLLTVLPGSPELRDLMLGSAQQDALIPRLGPATTWVDLTSASPKLGDELAAHAAAAALNYLDAPVGGGVAAAEAGALTFYIGGDADVAKKVAPVLSELAAKGGIHHLGPAGTGYVTKLIVNTLWFGQAVATAEAFLLAGAAGVAAPALFEVLSEGPAASRYLSDYFPAVLRHDYLPSFGLDRVVEELDSVQQLREQLRLPGPVADAVAAVHRAALEHFGLMDGELLAVAYLEELAGQRISADPAGVNGTASASVLDCAAGGHTS